MLAALPPVTPGPYVDGVKASLLRAGGQQYLWQTQTIVAGTTTSIAVLLERLKSGFFYPWGAAFELSCSGAPGTFEIDIQFSETDTNASYVTVGTITAVNSNNYGRYDMPNTVFPKFVRGFAKTWPNAVTATLLCTH